VAERLYLGMNFHLRNQKDTLTINSFPSVSYRLTGRLTFGLGAYYQWVELKKEWRFVQRGAQWGGIAFATFKTVKTIHVRVETDAVNIPALKNADVAGRIWQWRYLAGLHKEFTVSHRWKGNVQLLYNFRNRLKDGVPEKVEVRFGVAYRLLNPANGRGED
jgi:hypothetical protein